jgi:N-methylhydantoinase A
MDEGIPAKDLIIQRYLDIRYVGQSYELTIPWSENVRSAFNAAHQSAYGYSNLNTPIEIVNLRVRVTGVVHPPQLPALPFEHNDPEQSILKYHQVVFVDGTTNIPFYSYDLLKPGNLINGPAAIVRSDTTILIGKNDSIEVDQYQNLRITIGK